MKIDLHCHSKHSKRPSLWFMQKLGCPECFTEPLDLYDIALRRGMTAVTITDHNVIDGCLEIAHLPNTFISCEYTAYFPEDDCKIHVLAYNLTEAQHRELSQLRRNVREMAAYLQRERIHHACAHPLFAVNERLTPNVIEKLILLFQCWEWNGDLNPELNVAMQAIAAVVIPADIERFAEKHGLTPGFPDPWVRRYVAGSDDHSSLHLARACTEAPDADTLEAFWNALAAGNNKVHSDSGSPLASARGFYGIAFQFYTNRFRLEQFLHKDLFLRFLFRMLQSRPEPPETWRGWLSSFLGGNRSPDESALAHVPLLDLARFEAERLIRNDPELTALMSDANGEIRDPDQKWFAFVTQVSNRVIMHQGQRLLDRVRNASLFDLFESIGSAGALYSLLSPFFVGFGMYSGQRALAARLLDHFQPGQDHAEGTTRNAARVAVFTDSFFEDNVVAQALRGQLQTARSLERDYAVVTCAQAPVADPPAVHVFHPVDVYSAPEYPTLKLFSPPFLEMLDHGYRERFTHLHAATPGPVGLAALGVAKILQIPISGTFHTLWPQAALALTDDSYVEDMLWKFLVWFYDQMDRVFVQSHAEGEELVTHGFNPARIYVYPRGVDLDRFHPGKRGGLLAEHFSLDDAAVNFLYVGPLAPGKDLDLLAEAYQTFLAKVCNARLVIAGDGPYRADLEARLAQTPAIFTGQLQDDDLATLYASCDALIYPCPRPGFGDAVVEAQASGIPAIVAEGSCPREILVPGETALVVEPNNVDALVTAMEILVRDSERREAMGRNARHYMETHGFQHAFEQVWDLYCNAPDIEYNRLRARP